jgi:hypothetical protein
LSPCSSTTQWPWGCAAATTRLITISKFHRDILIEATSSQKVCTTSLNTGDQGGAPTLGQWPQGYRAWNEINIYKICDKNLNYALKHQWNIL